MATVEEILKDSNLFDSVARKSFDAADENKNGVIEQKELHAVIVSVAENTGVSAPTHQEVDEAFKQLDFDHSSAISFSEFRVLVRQVLETM
jgi:Ca2+-binding EF-hand superfamily protein